MHFSQKAKLTKTVYGNERERTGRKQKGMVSTSSVSKAQKAGNETLK